jgi:hypothetical protein
MSTTTLTPTDDDDSREFAELVADFDDGPPRRQSRRTLVLPERDAINQGLRFRRHRTREREI